MESAEGQSSLRKLRGRTSPLRNRALAATAAAGMILSAAACGSSSGKSSAQPTPSNAHVASGSDSPSSSASGTAPSGSAGSPTGSPDSAAQAAVASYRAAFVDWQTAGATSDYQSPVLADHMSGDALSFVTRTMYINKTKGAVTKGRPELSPTVGQMVPANAPTQIVINDCIREQSWLLYTTDGHLFDNVPGGNHKSQALVKYSAGAWKVDQLLIQPVGTC